MPDWKIRFQEFVEIRISNLTSYRNVFREGDLERGSVVAKNATIASDGETYQVDYFNLDDSGD